MARESGVSVLSKVGQKTDSAKSYGTRLCKEQTTSQTERSWPLHLRPPIRPSDVDKDDTDAPADIRVMALRDFTPAFLPYQNASDDPSALGPGTAISSTLPLSTSPSTQTVTDVVTVVPPSQTVTAAPTHTETAYAVAMGTSIAAPSVGAIAVKVAEPIGFSGLFFRCVAVVFGWSWVAARTHVAETRVFICSTFFGGHEKKYATPRDQFVWFKDFGMAINA